jgi:hypothetical protein
MFIFEPKINQLKCNRDGYSQKFEKLRNAIYFTGLSRGSKRSQNRNNDYFDLAIQVDYLNVSSVSLFVKV